MLLEDLKRHEGFSSDPYIDVLVKRTIPKDELAIIEKWLPKLNLTIGYGSLVKVDENEAEYLLEKRLTEKMNELVKYVDFWDDLTQSQKNGLSNMAYQIGSNGLMKFKNMLKAMKEKDVEGIEREARDSRWYRQATNRAENIIPMLVKVVKE
jgi:lysozyme